MIAVNLISSLLLALILSTDLGIVGSFRMGSPRLQLKNPATFNVAPITHRSSSVTMQAAIPFPSSFDPANVSKIFGIGQQITTKWSRLSMAVAAIFAAVLGKNIVSIKESFKSASTAMEAGWKKRGFGGSFARTVEVWGFAIYFLFRYVSIELCPGRQNITHLIHLIHLIPYMFTSFL